MNTVITFSPAYTIVPTYECFNRCSYCNFRIDLDTGESRTDSDILRLLQTLDRDKVIEILVLSGEVHPTSKKRAAWFTKIHKICEIALSCGFLPHTNVGPLSWSEMKQLKEVNVSMGLMLEQLNPKFMATVHKHAPSKNPQLRLQQLEWAGKLGIPFTTGLLLGIGETESDIEDSLIAIAQIHQQWGNVQEVILQPHSFGSQQEANILSFDLTKLPRIITQARMILPEGVAIQIPPNLVFKPDLLLKCLDAGATDLGGISPVDEVNPDYAHPTQRELGKILQSAGWSLRPRLPVYPKYYSWLSASLQEAVMMQEKT